MQVKDDRDLRKIGTKGGAKVHSPQEGTATNNANLAENMLPSTTSLTSLVKMHIKPDNIRGVGLISEVRNVCSLRYEAADGLGVSPH